MKCFGHEKSSRADSVTLLDAVTRMNANGTRKNTALSTIATAL